MGLTSDEENDDQYETEAEDTRSDRAVPAKRKKKVGRKEATTRFSVKLQQQFPFIEPSSKDSSRAQCKLCPVSKDGTKPSFRCEK